MLLGTPPAAQELLDPDRARFHAQQLRDVINEKPKDEATRQALADLAVSVAGRIEALDLDGDSPAAEQWAALIRSHLFDTLWRLGRLSEQDPDASLALGVAHRRGLFSERDLRKACEAYAEARDGGNQLAARRFALSCGATALVTAQPDDPPPNRSSDITSDTAIGPQETPPGQLVLAITAQLERAEDLGRSKTAAGLKAVLEDTLADELRGLRHLQATDRSPHTAVALGLLYRVGIGVEPNPGRACAAYRAASGGGQASGHYQWSLCLAESDPAAAIALLEQAAIGGSAAAQELLGRRCPESR